MTNKPAYEQMEQKVKNLEQEILMLKQREKALRESEYKLATHITSRIKAEKRIHKLNKLKEGLLISGPLLDKLKQITDDIVDIFKADFARIWLTEPGDACDTGCVHAGNVEGPNRCENRDMCLHLRSSSGRYTHIDGEHGRVPFGCYKIGRIASGKAPKFVTNDVVNDPTVHDNEWAARIGLNAFAGYRLLSASGDPMGVLALFSKNEIIPEEDALLESLASFTAQVVQTELAKEALRANEKFLDAIVENIPDMIFVKHAKDLTFARFNKAGENLLGYSRKELYGKNDYDFFPRAEAEFFIRKDREVLLNGEVLDIPEEKIHTKHKGERILHTRKIPIMGQDNTPRYLLGISEDITEKIEGRVQRQFQSQIMNQVHDSIIAVDMNGKITSWNKGSERLFQYHGSEITGKHVSLLYPQDFHGYLLEEVIPTLLSNGSHGYETSLIRKDESEFTGLVSLSVLKDDAGQTYGMIGYTLDVSEQKRFRQALADSERRLMDIIDFLPDPTWVIDLDGRVIAWNKAIEKLTGVDKKEILGKGGYTHAIPFYGKPRPVLIDLALNRDVNWENEYLKIKETDGKVTGAHSFNPVMGKAGRYLSGTAARLYDVNGEVVGAIETIRDITDAKNDEAEREHLISELKEAITKVQTLSGMLPICSACKKIRDDKGYWKQIESYISEHSSAEFSHSICPDCVKALYPDLDVLKD